MNRTHGVTHFSPDGCFGCKVLTIQLSTDPFTPHYNWSVGQHVNTRQEFEDALRRCSDANSEIVGLDHDYQPRYPGDTEPIRIADQAIDDHARAYHAT